MAKAYITEYSIGARDAKGIPLPVGQEPPLAEQVVDFSGGVAASAAFQPETQYVRVAVDAICSAQFGAAPVAVIGAKRLAANTVEYFGVQQGRGHKVSFVSNT